MQASSAPANVNAPACASPTIRSHGARVARSHAYDWAVLLLLVAVEGLLNAIEPFHRFVGAGMMTDLRYPMKTNTVPLWAVPVIAVIGPMIIFTVIYIRRRNVYDLHHATLGILFSVLITGVLTDAIKDAVGRPRPNFFWRCFPDGIAVYDNITTGVICHGDAGVIKEGHKSFPSGHTSWSFAGLGFLSFYLAGKITVFDRRGHVAKLCIVLFPLLVAAMIAISRVDDYWHHWQDVCTGGVLGMVVASVCYLQFFPPPSDERGFFQLMTYDFSRTIKRNGFSAVLFKRLIGQSFQSGLLDNLFKTAYRHNDVRFVHTNAHIKTKNHQPSAITEKKPPKVLYTCIEQYQISKRNKFGAARLG